MAGNIHEPLFALYEEMVVIGHVGVEIALGAVHRDLPQQADMAELVQRVVDGRERHRHAGALGFLEQSFRREVTIAAGEKQPAECHALAGGAQAHGTQAILQVMDRAAGKARRRAGCGRAGAGCGHAMALGSGLIHAP